MRTFCNFNQLVDLGRQLARGFQVGVKAGEFLLPGQLAVEQQVARLLEGRAFGEVVNRVPAVAQLAGAPIDVADARAVEVDACKPAMDVDLLSVFAHPTLHEPFISLTFRNAAQRPHQRCSDETGSATSVK